MHRFIPGSRVPLLVATFVFLSALPRASGQSNPATSSQAKQDEPQLRLKVASNLVVVRVVVRDAQGKPVENLKKEDFKLFDRGKEQQISHFEEQRSGADSASKPAAAQAAAPVSLTLRSGSAP